MLTIGPEDGEVTGRVGGEPVYHASLSPDAYQAILERLGLSLERLVAEDPDCDMHTVLLARKTS